MLPPSAGGDRPYLVSGADDRLVKVWDYQTKACIQVGISNVPGMLHCCSIVALLLWRWGRKLQCWAFHRINYFPCFATPS